MKVLNILVRRYLLLDRLDASVLFHEQIIGQNARLRFRMYVPAGDSAA